MKAGWEVKALGEVCSKIGSGATPRGGYESYKDVGISLIRSMNVHDLKFLEKDLAKIDDQQALALSNVEVSAGDVLLNITGASVARCCVAPSEMLPARVNQHVSILRPKPQALSSDFLAYLLVSKGMKDKLLGIGDEAGATRQALTKAQLQTFPILLPPLAEQKRIVAVLDAAFEGLTRARAHTETNLQNARELFESEMEESFRASQAERVSLESLIKIAHGYAFDGVDFHASQDDTLPVVLTPGNYTEDAKLSFEGAKTKRFTGPVPKEYLFDVGELTVVMTDLSSKMKILGKPAFVERDNVLHNQRIGRISHKGHGLDNRFLYYFLRTFAARKEIKDTATGTMVRHTAPKRILALNIPFPKSVADQQEVAGYLDELSESVSQLQSHYRAKLADLDDLRQSLLQKAFAGELT